MSSDRISAAARRKRKATINDEDLGFPPALKPIVTARPACNTRLLLCRQDSKDDGLVNLDITSTTSIGGNDNEGCETPKGEEHQIPKFLACPPAPRKARSTAKRKPGEFFYVSPVELNLLFNLSQPKKFQVR